MNKLTWIVALLLSIYGQKLAAQCTITLNGQAVIATDFCQFELPLQFSGQPAGGIFSGVGIFSNGFFNPSAAILDETVNNFTITYNSPTGCSTTLNINVLVPQQAVASPTIPNFVCQNDDPVPLSGNFDNSGGVFIINQTTIIDEFDPNFWGAGPHQILYTSTQNLGTATCFSYDTVFINVMPKPNTSFSGWQLEYCLTDSPTTLIPNDSDINGTFSGSVGITATNSFDPILAGVGNHQIIYSYTDISSICSNADTVTVSVIDTIAINFESIGSRCFGESDTLVYTGTPIGAGNEWLWATDDGTILHNGGDTLIVRWNNVGMNQISLDIVGNVCTGSPVVHSFEAVGIDLDAGEDRIITDNNPVLLNAVGTASDGSDLTFAWSPNSNITCTDCANPSVAPDESTTYYLTATSQIGCTASDTVRISVIKQRSLFVPNIFTPNSDGKNDDIMPLGSEIASIKFSIFDRWGSLVFETENIGTAWDGTINGKDAASGAYAYLLEVTFNDGVSDVYKGSITLVR
jgi:gliding motility-associated-like protein